MVRKILSETRQSFLRAKIRLLHGNRVNFGTNFRMRKNVRMLVKKDARIVIGDNVSFNNDCSLNALGLIEIGNDVIVGENVRLYDHNHSFKLGDTPFSEQPIRIGEIHIGNNCWIGSNVTILRGGVIGDNCVIGAGCVISREIPSNSLVRNDNAFNIEEIHS